VSRHLAKLALLLAASALGSADTNAQARGPSAREVQEVGLHIESMLEIRRQEWARVWGKEAREKERDTMRRDAALRASRLAELEAFLRRLSGRFRIAGTIERDKLSVVLHSGDPLVPPGSALITRSADVAGVADCGEIGLGVGVNCIISASWPAFDHITFPESCKPCQFIGNTAAEGLNTMRPAVLVLGLNKDPPELRAMLVTADSLTNEWAGGLNGNSARLVQTTGCTTVRCYMWLEILAEPESEVVSIIFRHTLIWQVNVTLTMHRDPQAQLEADLKPMRAR
jgi:hypothetical protein